MLKVARSPVRAVPVGCRRPALVGWSGIAVGITSRQTQFLNAVLVFCDNFWLTDARFVLDMMCAPATTYIVISVTRALSAAMSATATVNGRG